MSEKTTRPHSGRNDAGRRRLGLGLAQAELAARCGVSRSFLSLVESGRTQPNVEIALRLARELGCSVEDLFSTDHAAPPAPGLEVVPAGGKLAAGARVALARIAARWVAHATDTPDVLASGFPVSDAVLVHAGRKVVAQPRRPLRELEQNIAIAGCDPALALLCAERGGDRKDPGGRAFWVNCGSGRALKLLADGEVHAAGLHYAGEAQDENRRQVQRRDPQGRWVLVRFTRWESGWLVHPDARARFRGAEDLANKKNRLANREVGSGSRHWLDRELGRVGLRPGHLRGYDQVWPTHWACARALHEGRAEVAVGPRALAAAFGLGFVPAEEVAFDLVIPKEHLGHPRMQALLERLASRAFREDVAMLAGYRSDGAGTSIDR